MCCTAFVAMLFNFFFKRRSSETNGGEASNDATANDGAASAFCTDTSTEGQEMATSLGYGYEVFLSFRGPDTRAGITNILYISLIDAGIRTYKDDEDLHEGEEIGPKLLQAINQSKISIPIFSKGYASSVWCLKELVQMVEHHKTGRQKIMPIFYDVVPSEVRCHNGVYKGALLLHKKKKRCDEETMSKWKDALSVVGELKGWDLQSEKNRREGEFAKMVTQKVLNELKNAYLVVPDSLVNVDHHVDVIMDKIDAPTMETRIIGIYGMGGIGKTTIAKIIYNKLSQDFENSCFLPDIRETSEIKGVKCLQSQLISSIVKTKCTDIEDAYKGTQTIRERLYNKRVLLLLDDVDKRKHMDALVGKLDWLGKGSKLIITTREKDVLKVLKLDCSYEVKGMDFNQSLQLFSKHAFRRDYPLPKYIRQSKRAIKIAGGLPLALEVIGSLLSCTEKEMWDANLKKLEEVPSAEVHNKLKISYDALDEREKHIFLDIACFFIGYNKDIVVHFYDESKYFPEVALEVLQNRSLIKYNEHNEVWMHDQLRDLGREIVRLESKMKLEKQSRVWNPKDALDLLKKCKAKYKVEALCLKFDHQQQHWFTYDNFMRLSNLRFLEVDSSMENFCARGRFLWHELASNVLPANVFQGNSDLLPQLQWLCWHNIPPTFNITNFSMADMAIVDLSESEVTHDWNGWTHMKVIKNLKVLNLTNCFWLEKTPDFSAHANLKRLILRGCCKLVEIDKSICQLKCLVSLDVRYCRTLQMLPDELGGDLASLEYLSLEGCESLEILPDSIGNMKSLIELDVSGTKIEELPDSIRNLKKLKAMKMNENRISEIPDALSMIEKLEEIEARGTLSCHVKIGNGICRSQSLRTLRLTGAAIDAIPELPGSLFSLHLSKVHWKRFPDLSNLTCLKELDLKFGPRHCDAKSYEVVEDPVLSWIGKLSKLESLLLHSDDETSLPADISLLPQLKALNLRRSNLSCLPRLPSSLLSLSLFSCKSLCSMDLSNLKKLSSLVIWFSAISEIRGLDCLENLQYLQIIGLREVKRLPDLSNLNKLRSLEIQDCGYLVEIQGKLPQSLKELRIHSCESLQRLPELSILRELQFVDIDDRTKVNVEAILGFPRRS